MPINLLNIFLYAFAALADSSDRDLFGPFKEIIRQFNCVKSEKYRVTRIETNKEKYPGLV